MTVKLHRAGVKKANELIDAGKVNTDDKHWSISPEEENMMLGNPPDYEEYGKWFLGIDDEANPNTKGAYKYPIGKHGAVHRQALIGDRTRSAQNGAEDIFAAAGKLIKRIDERGSDAPASSGAWWRITARAKALGGGNVLYIYGDIGENPFDDESWSAIELVRALDALDGGPLAVRLNSWGGSVADGLAMHNAIKRYAGPVTVSIDAQAASIASLIAMAGDTVEMAENALMMIHAPWSVAMGNAVDFREAADMLDSYAAAMLPCYTARADGDEAAGWLADGKDHWFTAQQALDAGLVDSITEASREAAHYARNSRFNPPRRASTMLTKEQLKARAKKLDAIFAAHRDIEGVGALEREVLADHEITVEDAQARLQTILDTANSPQAKKDAAKDNVVSIEDARKGALADVQARNAKVRQVFAQHRSVDGVADLEAEILADHTVTVEQAQAKLLAKIGEGTQALGGDAHLVVDARDKFREGITKAITARAGVKPEKADEGNEFRGYSLLEIARASLELRGQPPRGMSRHQVVAEAFTLTDSDLAYLTANIAHKFLLKGWDEAPETFQQWTQPGVLPDFKPAKRVGLNLFDSLEQIEPGQEYTYGDLSDRGETIALAKYGKLLAITYETIINDDLNALSKVPMLMGRAAKRTIGNLVYAVLTGNPDMSDGNPLFDASHNNLAGTAAALDSTTVNDMVVGMATQEDPDGKAKGGLNIPLKYVLVPMALKAKAQQVANSEFMVEAANVNVRQPNIVRGAFTPIADARLDAASKTAFYGVADPGAFDTVEVAYLDGQQEPYLEQQRGFEIDGIAYKVRMVAGVSPLDFRSFYKNAGA